MEPRMIEHNHWEVRVRVMEASSGLPDKERLATSKGKMGGNGRAGREVGDFSTGKGGDGAMTDRLAPLWWVTVRGDATGWPAEEGWSRARAR